MEGRVEANEANNWFGNEHMDRSEDSFRDKVAEPLYETPPRGKGTKAAALDDGLLVGFVNEDDGEEGCHKEE